VTLSLSSRGAVAGLGSRISTATTAGREATTAITLETATTLATTTAITATAATTSRVTVAEGVGAGTALLEDDLLGANLVGVGSNGGSVASRLSELNKGSVLKSNKLDFDLKKKMGKGRCRMGKRTLGRLTSKYLSLPKRVRVCLRRPASTFSLTFFI
jgi:hypothetical protein